MLIEWTFFTDVLIICQIEARQRFLPDRTLVKALLRASADPFARTDIFRLAALHLAVEEGHSADVVGDLLIAMKALWPKDEPFNPDLRGHKWTAWQKSVQRFGRD